jgi:hypothetical protein
VTPEYLSGLSNFIAKGWKARQFAQDMAPINPNDTPEAWLTAHEYVRDMLGQTEEATGVKKVMGLYFIAGDLSAVALNTAQNWTHGVNILREIVPEKGMPMSVKLAEKYLIKANKDIIEEFANAWWTGRKPFRQANKWLTQEEVEQMDKLYEEGMLDASFFGELSGLHNEKVYAHYLTKLQKFLYAGFSGVEGLNRMSTGLAALRRAKDAGIKDQLDVAIDKILAAHFPYGKKNAPEVLRKMGKLGSAAATFATYPINNIVFYKHRLVNGLLRGTTEQRRLQMKVLGGNLAYMIAFGGLYALPFAWLARKVWDIFTDPEEDPEVLIKKHAGNAAGNMLLRGSPAAWLGNDMSWRLEGTSVLDFNGLPIGLAAIKGLSARFGRGFKKVGQGDYWGLVDFAPDIIRNPAIGLQGYIEGGDRRNAPPIKYTGREALTRAAGFTPTREAETRHVQEVKKNEQEARNDLITDIVEDFIIVKKNNDLQKEMKLRAKVNEYNKKQDERKTGVAHIVWKEDILGRAKRAETVRGTGYAEQGPVYMRPAQRTLERDMGMEETDFPEKRRTPGRTGRVPGYMSRPILNPR